MIKISTMIFSLSVIFITGSQIASEGRLHPQAQQEILSTSVETGSPYRPPPQLCMSLLGPSSSLSRPENISP